MTSVLLGSALLLVAAAGPAKAEHPRGYSFLAALEYSFAVSPEEFTDYYSGGLGATVGIEYSVSPNWAFIGSINVKRYGPAEGTIKDWWTDPGEWPNARNIEVSEGQLTAVTFSVMSKGSLKKENSRSYPYVKGGFGLTIAGADEIKVTFDNLGTRQTEWQAGIGSETNISIIIGIGFESLLGEGNSSLFFDAGLHVIMQEEVNPTVAPITVGLKF
jgi:hypothetical protein